MQKHEINIYGDIVPFKYWDDGSEYDRSDLNQAIDGLDLKEGDELIYNIHTFGGCTTTAFAMYNKLLRVKNEKKITLTSRSDGYCASSGVILLLAGDKRIGSKYLKPFVHNAWTWSGATNKEDAKKIYEDLVNVDTEIANLYAENTSISKEKALELMNESRDVTLDECLDFGFYTEIENVYASENKLILNSLRSRNKKSRNKPSTNTNNMSKEALTKEEATGLLDGFLKNIKSFLKPSAKNKMVLDATGEREVNFPDLEDDDIPSVGDKATIDGTSAEGDVLMPSGETYVFVAGELTEIKPKEEEESDDSEEIENLKEEVVNMTAQLNSEKLKVENLEKESKDMKALLQNASEDMIAIKKAMGSNFSHDAGDKKNKKEDTASRSVWKSKKD